MDSRSTRDTSTREQKARNVFGFESKKTVMLKFIERQTILLEILYQRIQRDIRIVMSNQDTLDAYAAAISEQNGQIKAAVAVVIPEIKKLQNAAEKPLDTTKIDAAIAQLTSAVDEVEAIPAPVAEGPVTPVEVSFEELATKEVE